MILLSLDFVALIFVVSVLLGLILCCMFHGPQMLADWMLVAIGIGMVITSLLVKG